MLLVYLIIVIFILLLLYLCAYDVVRSTRIYYNIRICRDVESDLDDVNNNNTKKCFYIILSKHSDKY